MVSADKANIARREEITRHRTNAGVRIGQTTTWISDIGRCPGRGDGIIIPMSDRKIFSPYAV
ncbi:MAG TPA: hypothetical protein VN450_08535, partial [Candidatus Methylomirabilis sp.]|nr:hypothetical protein [Candidatus Methylomirabilis sp.]